MVTDIQTDDDYQQLLEASRERPVFLIKHSTTCPISKGAWQRFTEFAEEETRVEYRRVLVRENSTLSEKIAEYTEIEHQSPQVILFHDGEAIWKTSHRSINAENLGRQLKRLAK